MNVPGVMLDEGTVYSIFAMGLAGGEPGLMAVPSADARYDLDQVLAPLSQIPDLCAAL